MTFFDTLRCFITRVFDLSFSNDDVSVRSEQLLFLCPIFDGTALYGSD